VRVIWYTMSASGGGAGRKGKKERVVDATQITRTPTYKSRPNAFTFNVSE